jgi:hypothetical protein
MSQEEHQNKTESPQIPQPEIKPKRARVDLFLDIICVLLCVVLIAAGFLFNNVLGAMTLCFGVPGIIISFFLLSHQQTFYDDNQEWLKNMTAETKEQYFNGMARIYRVMLIYGELLFLFIIFTAFMRIHLGVYSILVANSFALMFLPIIAIYNKKYQ